MAIVQAVLSTIGSTALISLMSRVGARGTYEIENSLVSGLKVYLLNHFSTQQTIAVEEYDGLVQNELYSATKLYLATTIDPHCTCLKAYKSQNEKDITIAMGLREETLDSYNGVEFKWAWFCKKTDMHEYQDPSNGQTHFRSEVQTFEVTFHKKHKDIAVNSYLPFIPKQSKEHQQNKKTVKLYTTNEGRHSYISHSEVWSSIPLNHPSTFETLAMEPDMKQELLNDIDLFLRRSDKYKKVGKTWKRGYLLYGPPGTGKSSLVAAMANYLGFDVYDLALTDLRSNADLRRLLVSTTNRSILLVEDIDCAVQLHDRANGRAPPPQSHDHRRHRDDESKVTLSGFLNFIDGLWSSCGDERIIVFTTNHKETLDPALLRPGRMDFHIHMSYCTPAGFKLLASNYHGIEDHVSYEEIENLINNVEVTPAEVAEQLLKNDSVDVAMEKLIEYLHVKMAENEMVRVEEAEVEEDLEEYDEEQEEEEGTGNNERMFVEDDVLLALFWGLFPFHCYMDGDIRCSFKWSLKAAGIYFKFIKIKVCVLQRL